jgi:hypothetical protein
MDYAATHAPELTLETEQEHLLVTMASSFQCQLKIKIIFNLQNTFNIMAKRVISGKTTLSIFNLIWHIN